MHWVGVDVGGTFTDGVLYDDQTKSFRYEKAPSTPGDPVRAVLSVIEQLGADPRRMGRFSHGITIGTNAILEHKGAEVWMLTTKGFRDVLDIARTNRHELYNIRTQKTPPILPRTRSIEINERLRFDGTVLRPLDEAEVRAALGPLARRDVGALIVCFLHSYANPRHEDAATEIAREILPDWYICSSSSVLPQYREYERFNTTALNAYIGPITSRYLQRLEGRLGTEGYRHRVYIMTSNGGVATAERASRLPVSTILSGPAGGVAAAVELGRRLGEKSLITCDMGGTSTDVCLIENLKVPITNQQFIGGYANRTPQIAINAVGAGGGSISWLDDGNILKVGPQSAGADPSPACYRRGGTDATITDANLVLNRLSPHTKLAGRLELDLSLAVEAIEALAARMGGMDAPQLAEGIVRIAVMRMVSAIKEISIGEGYDPRDFALLPYGGAGPMHACAIAEELDIRTIVVPIGPGNFAALGSLISDLRRDYNLTKSFRTDIEDFKLVEDTFTELEETARVGLMAEGADPSEVTFQRSLGMRYLGQSWELDIEVSGDIRSMDALRLQFAEAHDRRFGHKSGGITEIVEFRAAAIGRVQKPSLGEPISSSDGNAPERRRVYFEGHFVDTPVYERSAAPTWFEGPAIVEETGATTVVAPGWSARIVASGEIILTRAPS